MHEGHYPTDKFPFSNAVTLSIWVAEIKDRFRRFPTKDVKFIQVKINFYGLGVYISSYKYYPVSDSH